MARVDGSLEAFVKQVHSSHARLRALSESARDDVLLALRAVDEGVQDVRKTLFAAAAPDSAPSPAPTAAATFVPDRDALEERVAEAKQGVAAVLALLVVLQGAAADARHKEKKRRLGLTKDKKDKDKDKDKEKEKESKKVPPLSAPKDFLVANYFSLGIDGEALLRFHELRERKPEYFKSRFVNYGWYAVLGMKGMLSDFVTLDKACTMRVDGVDVALPKGVVSLVSVNIPSFAGGLEIWDSSTALGAQCVCDARIELGLVRSNMHLTQIQVRPRPAPTPPRLTPR